MMNVRFLALVSSFLACGNLSFIVYALPPTTAGEMLEKLNCVKFFGVEDLLHIYSILTTFLTINTKLESFICAGISVASHRKNSKFEIRWLNLVPWGCHGIQITRSLLKTSISSSKLTCVYVQQRNFTLSTGDESTLSFHS